MLQRRAELYQTVVLGMCAEGLVTGRLQSLLMGTIRFAGRCSSMCQSPLRHEFLLKATRINAGVAPGVAGAAACGTEDFIIRDNFPL